MPRTAVDIDRFQAEIARRVLQDCHSLQDIIRYLQGEGVAISRNTLKARLNQRGITCHNLTLDANVVASISNLFHTTRMTEG